jgi:ribonuclease P protein component
MPKKQRISRSDFASLPKKARRNAGNYFSVSVSELPASSKVRATCVISKKVIQKAHDRNLVKRRCREAVRPLLPSITRPLALVFYAKKSARDASFAEIKDDIASMIAVLR